MEQEQIAVVPDELVNQEFELEKLLGQGMGGEVWMAHTKAGQRVVLKKMPKKTSNFDRRRVEKEIKATSSLMHDHIIKYLAHFETNDHVYMVLEYLDGVDLFACMKMRNYRLLKEQTIKKVLKQIIDAVLFCHERGVVHRDIKLDNVISDTRGNIKLIDFGLCEFVNSKETLLRGWVGSLEYAAPEILHRIPYSGFKSDVWSMGVLLYSLLYGEFPFLMEDFLNKGVHPPIAWPDEERPFGQKPIRAVSRVAKDLVKKMLNSDPKTRISLQDVSQHEWFANTISLSSPSMTGSYESREAMLAAMGPAAMEAVS